MTASRGAPDHPITSMREIFMYLSCLLAAALIVVQSVASAEAEQPLGAKAGDKRAAAAGQVLSGPSDAAFPRIQGNALDSASRGLANSVVRLRDARSGRIVSSRTTD